MKIAIELDLDDPAAEVRYLRAHASQIPYTYKDRRDWFLMLADRIEEQIKTSAIAIRLTPREIANISEASKRHPQKVQLVWNNGQADLVDPPAWALKWLRSERGSGREAARKEE